MAPPEVHKHKQGIENGVVNTKNKKGGKKGNKRDMPTKCSFPELHPAGKNRAVRKRKQAVGQGDLGRWLGQRPTDQILMSY